jgi:hypothetical protein
MLLVHALFKIYMYCTTVGCLGVEKLENKGMCRYQQYGGTQIHR